jgi:hypothetical protein
MSVQTEIQFHRDWPKELIPRVREAVQGKGDDWEFVTDFYENERYFIARRKDWPCETDIYVRDGFERFLKVLKEDERDENGQKKVAIEKGSREGKYYNEWAFGMMEEVALSIGTCIHGVENLKVWYDQIHDYTCLEFDVDGSHYLVRHYKIFSCEKNGVQRYENVRHFGSSKYALIQFFRFGKHRRWEV